MKRSVRNSLVALMLLGLFGPDASAQQPAQPATLWSFLGIPQGMRKVRGSVTNRRGNRPGLEGRLPLRALNDPANLAEGMPAVVRKGAEVKIAEDLKRQKIKAIKYLASIGCGCYDLDGSITQAMVEALGDCTEDVRMAAVEAIAEAAEGKCCANCGQSCCCKEPIVKKLASMAYERDDHGCWIEPSARVRQAAARALMICCPDTVPGGDRARRDAGTAAARRKARRHRAGRRRVGRAGRDRRCGCGRRRRSGCRRVRDRRCGRGRSGRGAVAGRTRGSGRRCAGPGD